jgi:RHS repeat-associated protein
VTGEVAGSLAGKVTVSERGELNYTIKLSAPPGVGGMVPELTLHYSSKDGNGPLGMGWSLAGLPSISRCPQTAAGHGTADPVDFDGNDRYCLDGTELVATSGTYGSPGTEYRTAADAVMRLFSREIAGDGPLWFTAERKDSLVYEFGRSAQSRRFAQNQNAILQWMVNKVSDRNGNYYAVQYDGDRSTGEIWPTSIMYTLNDMAAGVSGTNSIQFTWGTSPGSVQHSYVGASRFVSSRSLQKITYITDGQVAREYRLAYTTQESPAELRLSSVTECGGGGECLPPTVFSWAPVPDLSNGYSYVATAVCDDLTPSQGFGSGNDQPLEAGDWNGDGRQDLARLTMNGVALCLSDGSGFVSRRPTGSPLSSERSCTADTCFSFTGDWNGDGRLDFAHTGNGRQIQFYITGPEASTYTVFAELDWGGAELWSVAGKHTNPIITGDWNGDGRTDFGRVGRDFLFRYISTPSGLQELPRINDFGSGNLRNNTESPIFVGDWNGDGLTDFGRVWDEATYRFYVSQSDGGASLYQDLSPSPYLYIPRSGIVSPFLIGDYNGDGLHDFARVAEVGTIIFESTGYGFAPPRVIGVFGQRSDVFWSNNDHPLRVGDWNRDGISDIARVSNTQLDLLASKGDSLAFHASIADMARLQGYDSNDSSPLVVGDWNADGFTDIARANDRFIRIYQHLFHEARALVAITDGFGARTEIQYSYLHDPAVYEPASGATYPWVDTKSGVRVVASLASANGIGGVARSRYKYFGARSGVASGLGSAGFSRIEVTNEADGSVSTTWYSQESPYGGMPIREERRVATGVTVSRKVNTWATLTRQTGLSFPYVSQTIDESWDLDGTLINRKTTNSTLDEYGSPTRIHVSHLDGLTESTVAEYRNDPITWTIGQLVRTTVTKQAPDTQPSTRTVLLEYLPGTNLLVREIVEPDLPAFRVERSYSHDIFGNIISSTVSAPGVETRNETVQFDPSGRFPLRMTNALGQVTEHSFDARHGLIASVTDPNGVMTQAVFDAFGRETLKIYPSGVQTRMLYLRSPATGAPIGTSYYVRTDRSGAPPVFSYHDQLGRVTREESSGFDGRPIYVDRVFNPAGQQIRVSDPYFAGSTPVWTETEYDLLGRPVWNTLPGNRITHTRYQGRTVEMTDPLGKISRRTYNTLGKTVSSTDPMGGTVSFRYDSVGNLIHLTDPAGNVTETTYDQRGNITAVREPNTGVTEFMVDGLGRRISELRSDGSVVSVTYDKLDRLVSRTTPDGIDSWEYDTAPNGIGKLARASSGNIVDRMFYDLLGRPSRSERMVGNTALASTQAYDSLGRPHSVTFPSGLTVRRVYNAFGYLSAVVRSPDQSLLWRVDEMSASGKVLTETYGNGIVTRRSYDAATEFLNRIQAQSQFDMTFSFDPVGNLTAREDTLLQLREEFTYDNLYRLTESRVVGSSAVTVTYDSLGNILQRSDVGSYVYGENGAGPHAVTSISGPQGNIYSYDRRGNRTSALGETIEYAWFNLPRRVSRGSVQVDFSYGPENTLAEQVVRGKSAGSAVFNLVNERKIFFGGDYEKIFSQGGEQDVHYISGLDNPVVVLTTDPTGEVQSRYLHPDHLGSIAAVSDQAGVLVERMSFDPWGLKRNVNWTPANTPVMSQIDRSFTGHQYLDHLSLIHMGGRVYDPVVGRFLSADPFIQEPENSQSLNRYSYVLNNPLSYTDPSGYFFKKLFRKVLKVAVIVGIAVFSQPYVAGFVNQYIASEIVAKAVTGVILGISTSTVNSVLGGGSLADGFKAGLRDVPWSAAAAVVASQIGDYFEKLPADDFLRPSIREAKAVAHGISQGALGAARGEKFIPAMLSGAVADYSSGFNGDFKLIRAVVAGGAAAAIGGGRFEDGAMRAAFVHLYNFQDGFFGLSPSDGEALWGRAMAAERACRANIANCPGSAEFQQRVAAERARKGLKAGRAISIFGNASSALGIGCLALTRIPSCLAISQGVGVGATVTGGVIQQRFSPTTDWNKDPAAGAILDGTRDYFIDGIASQNPTSVGGRLLPYVNSVTGAAGVVKGVREYDDP